MMEKKPRYPVGMQRFSEIREADYLYVDKTDLVYRLTRDSRYVFLSRPRRFGKSLLVSTLQCYFEGRKDLFAGLAMERLETEWNVYPVVRLELNTVIEEDSDKLRAKLIKVLDTPRRKYGVETSGEPGDQLKDLIQGISEKTGKKVVLLIDEYDTPVLNVLQNPETSLKIRKVMREFYSAIKPSEDYLRFVFLTGISSFSQLGVFSELNNLTNISNREEYAALCGITLQELKDNFQYGIRHFEEKNACSYEEALAMLREQYDGYHFTKQLVDVFNPYSLLCAFDERDMDDYWFRTGTAAFVIEMLRKHRADWSFNIEEIDGTEPMVLSGFNTPLEQATGPMPLLYQTGYFTIKSYNAADRTYVLGVPNEEVRIGLLMNLIPLYSSMNSLAATTVANQMSTALCVGDYDAALRYAQSFIAGIPFMEGDHQILAHQELREAYYHRILFIIFRLLNNGVQAQVRQALGMPDIVVTTRKYLYVIEVKIDASPEVALQQIEEKNYALPYQSEGKEIVKLGVNFSSQSRTIAEWKRGE
jgi:hypothetical protein